MEFEAAVYVPVRDPVQLELTTVVAASIPNQLANLLIRQLSTTYPLTCLKHLKRVRKLDSGSTMDIILCTLQDLPSLPCGLNSADNPGSMPCPEDALPDVLVQLVQQHQLQPTLLHVPAHAPQTRVQWQEWSKVWPITWKVPDQTAQVPTLTEKEQSYFSRHMTAAFRLSTDAACLNAALIVDPETQCVVAQATCNTAHPLEHAAMVAIRNAAARDKQLWPSKGELPAAAAALPLGPDQNGSSNQAPTPVGGDDDMAQWNAAAAGPSLCQDDCVEQAASKRPRLLPANEDSSLRSVGAPGEGQGPSTSAATEYRPYMCTRYDCFLVQEPCIMCAMALVHSRLQRVVYCRRNTQHGALGGRCRLHAQRSLNHHYQVFHLPMKTDNL